MNVIQHQLALKMRNRSKKKQISIRIFSLVNHRSAHHVQMNIMLRDQLDRAHLANQQLTDDLRRSTAELQQLREDHTKKIRDWKEEERVRSIFEKQNTNLVHFRYSINIITKNII